MTDTKDMIHIKYLVQLIWLYLLNNVENINNKKRTAFMLKKHKYRSFIK